MSERRPVREFTILSPTSFFNEMRKNFFLIVVPGIVIGIIFVVIVMAFSKSASSPETELLQPVNSSQKTAADGFIRMAQNTIKSFPKEPKGYNLLASAFIQKARETGDFSFNARAESALDHSFRVAPDNYEGSKIKAALLLNFHDFPEALKVSKRLAEKNPRDHEVYGVLTDALVELGDYKAAVDAAQKMVDLRPDTASYSRVSYLRSLHGDTEGAVEIMKMAVESASPANPEGVAWCRVHLGDELSNLGKFEEAEREYDHALYLFPEYHLALAAKARARYAAGDIEGAEKFYKRAIERVPLPEYIIPLGELYEKLGRADEAARQYEQVEFIEKNGAETYSRQLALFWADRGKNLEKALEIAENERRTRKDIYTLDALAWCLYKKGKFNEAQAAINEALRLGTRDAQLLYHAGMISLAKGDNEKGREYLKRSLSINPNFNFLQAQTAKEKLSELGNA